MIPGRRDSRLANAERNLCPMPDLVQADMEQQLAWAHFRRTRLHHELSNLRRVLVAQRRREVAERQSDSSTVPEQGIDVRVAMPDDSGTVAPCNRARCRASTRKM